VRLTPADHWAAYSCLIVYARRLGSGENFMADFELLRDDADQILNSGADRLFAAY
jgi:hypothetical protein